VVHAREEQATGISKSTISEVLAGKKPFSRQMIRKLAAYFEVDVKVLAGEFVRGRYVAVADKSLPGHSAIASMQIVPHL
jgi:transcriptional regulator with XRE-family HTH domain